MQIDQEHQEIVDRFVGKTIQSSTTYDHGYTKGVIITFTDSTSLDISWGDDAGFDIEEINHP
jgi:hypothetical protein